MCIALPTTCVLLFPHVLHHVYCYTHTFQHVSTNALCHTGQWNGVPVAIKTLNMNLEGNGGEETQQLMRGIRAFEKEVCSSCYNLCSLLQFILLLCMLTQPQHHDAHSHNTTMHTITTPPCTQSQHHYAHNHNIMSPQHVTPPPTTTAHAPLQHPSPQNRHVFGRHTLPPLPHHGILPLRLIIQSPAACALWG